MAYENCEEAGDWRDSPFFMVLYDYTVKNTGMPTDMGTLIAYLLLFVVTWYVIIWVTRLLLSLVWPVIIVVSALFLFRYLLTLQSEDLFDMLFQTVTLVAEKVLMILNKMLEFTSNFLK